jgi:hypothetical protein
MDDNRFDSLARTLAGGTNSRRRLLRTLGGGTLAALLGRLGLEEAVAACVKSGRRCGDGQKCCQGAKCKHGRCKCVNGGTPCGGTCCTVGQVCDNGICFEKEVPPPPGCGRGCKAGDECVDGACVVRAGTCPATADHCAVDQSLCNGASGCFCLPTLVRGDVRCVARFVPGSACGSCQSDADCAAVEAGAVCVAPSGGGCPCPIGRGICARRCPTPTP